MKGQRALKGYQHLRDPPQRALKSQRVSFSPQNPSNCAVSAASWEEGSAAPVRQPPAHDPVQPAYLSPAFASAICNRQPFQSRIFFRNILVIRFLAVDAPAQWTRVIGSGRACAMGEPLGPSGPRLRNCQGSDEPLRPGARETPRESVLLRRKHARKRCTLFNHASESFM